MSEASDELVSQFMAFTGSADVERAKSYLEMSGGNVETAVGLYLEHTTGGGGGGGDAAGGAAAAASPAIRAPDETRTMRLMDHDPMMMMMPGGGGGAGGLLGALMDQEDDDDMMLSASAFARAVDPRAAVNAAAAAAAAAAANDDDDDEDMMPQEDGGATPTLGDLFAPPTHLIHKAGGFQGARAVAKDARRWLLVNLQRDSEFSSHALNRDVWRDELVENLVREGFIFWQSMDTSPDGRTYAERYGVHDYPHVAIIDPRTGRLMWRKEGWTQEHPLTSEAFAEHAMDFCSRHSFDKPPVAVNPKPKASVTLDNDDDDDEVEYLGTAEDIDDEEEEEEEEQGPSFIQELLEVQVSEEPTTTGARIQIRMPDAKRLVRKFSPQDSVKTLYAFVAQSNEEAKGGKEFSLMAGFPPKDLLEDIDNTIESCGLAGQAVTVRWKE